MNVEELKKLCLSHNQIIDINIFEKINLKELRLLYLSYNKIPEINSVDIVRNLINIHRIYFTCNKITPEKIKITDNCGGIIVMDDIENPHPNQ